MMITIIIIKKMDSSPLPLPLHCPKAKAQRNSKNRSECGTIWCEKMDLHELKFGQHEYECEPSWHNPPSYSWRVHTVQCKTIFVTHNTVKHGVRAVLCNNHTLRYDNRRYGTMKNAEHFSVTVREFGERADSNATAMEALLCAHNILYSYTHEKIKTSLRRLTTFGSFRSRRLFTVYDSSARTLSKLKCTLGGSVCTMGRSQCTLRAADCTSNLPSQTCANSRSALPKHVSSTFLVISVGFLARVAFRLVIVLPSPLFGLTQRFFNCHLLS